MKFTMLSFNVMMLREHS